MAEPLSQTEIATLSRGVGGTPWHLTFVDVFSPQSPGAVLSLEEVADRVADRLPFAPRFRQRIRETVTGLDWVDDTDFDVSRHVRRVTLEAPGSLTQVTDLVAAGMTTPFDPAHPQWDLTLVDGLRGGQVALVCRSHPSYVDGGDHVHLIHELYDDEPVRERPQPPVWEPTPERNVGDDIVSGVMGGLNDPAGMLGRLGSRVLRTVGQSVEWAQSQGLPGLLRREPVAPSTRYAGGVLVSLAAVNRVRDAAGVTTHDVLLGLVTAGLRQWQTQLGDEPSDVVALVPLAVHERGRVPSAIGCAVAPQYVMLPARNASPQGRIDQIASLTRTRIDSGATVGAERLTRLAGFAPATLHAVAARTVSSGRDHDLYVGNVPGPRSARWFGEWQLHSSYPVLGLADSEDVTVCITTYNGRVGIGVAAAAPVPAFVEGVTSELSRLDGGRR
ncbi:MAG TPA: wax ester/triacylglycerol synthase domain-containing protein [Propionibacteriaceae bacterium]|nr:wax ester/triacylglycerol synthase domain-containing protein [Propionibacteriaceae bacterium]